MLDPSECPTIEVKVDEFTWVPVHLEQLEPGDIFRLVTAEGELIADVNGCCELEASDPVVVFVNEENETLQWCAQLTRSSTMH